MEKIVSRVRSIQDYYHLSDRMMATNLGIIPQTLGNQLKGRRSMGLETIVAILKNMPQISAEWLLRGEGKMMRTHSSSSISSENTQLNAHDSNVNTGSGSLTVNSGSGTLTVNSDSILYQMLEEERARNAKLEERIDKLFAMLDK